MGESKTVLFHPCNKDEARQIKANGFDDDPGYYGTGDLLLPNGLFFYGSEFDASLEDPNNDCVLSVELFVPSSKLGLYKLEGPRWCFPAIILNDLRWAKITGVLPGLISI